jgi:hypothetical protein
MAPSHDTGMELLVEAAEALDLAAGACDTAEDAAYFATLAVRIRTYLAESRPTTTLGMPRIPPGGTQLTDETVIHRSGAHQQSHIRIIPE